MSKKDFHFPLMYKEWLVSTAGWDADLRGWYINLLCHQADKGELPPDDESLAELAGVKFSNFKRFQDVFEANLKAKFQANEQGMLVNLTLDEILHDRKEYLSNRSKSGTVGALIKKGKRMFPDFEDWDEVADQLIKIDLEPMTMKQKEATLKANIKATIKAKNKLSFIDNDNDNNSINDIEVIAEVVKGKKIVIPEEFEKKEFADVWDLWKVFRKNTHKFTFLNEDSESRKLAELHKKSGGDHKRAIKILQSGIDNNWKGFFEESTNKKQSFHVN